MLIWKNWFVFIVVIVLVPQAFATDTGYPNDTELVSLPNYCQVKLRKKAGEPEYKTWESTLGPDFIHTHHFCAGLNFINRHYRARSEYDRKYYLQSSLGEFGYMITHASPSYSLMPEVYINRGAALSKLGRNGEAISDFQKAIELNPRLPKAYSVMADFYTNIKLQGKALAIVTEGLRYIPNSRMLQRRYDELGGKQPFPEPYELATDNVQQSVEIAEESPPSEPKADSDVAGKSEPDSTEPQLRTQQNQSEQLIGTPSNPWCRFCTDSDIKPQ